MTPALLFLLGPLLTQDYCWDFSLKDRHLEYQFPFIQLPGILHRESRCVS